MGELCQLASLDHAEGMAVRRRPSTVQAIALTISTPDGKPTSKVKAGMSEAMVCSGTSCAH